MSFMKSIFRQADTDYSNSNVSTLDTRSSWLYIGSLIFYLSITLIDEKTLAFQSVPSFVFSGIRYVCLALIAIKIILSGDFRYYTRHGCCYAALLTGLLLVVSTVNGSRTLLHYELIVLGAYRIPFRQIAKWVVVSQCVVMAVIVLLSFAGYIPSIVNYRSTTDSVRYSLGFSFPTYPAILAYYLSSLVIYVRSNRMRVIEYISIVVVNVAFYYYTATRTEIILVGFMLMCSILLRSRFSATIGVVLRGTSIVLPFLLLALSLLLSVVYTPNSTMLRSLNNALSDRLALAHKGLNTYGVQPFGQDIEWKNWEDLGEDEGRENFNIVDNGYINILLNYGPFVLSVLLFGFALLGFRAADPYLHIALCAMYIHMMLTPQLLQLIYDAYLLCFAPMILNAGERVSPKNNLFRHVGKLVKHFRSRSVSHVN